MKVLFEYTDTFGGEANYSWVKREERVLHDDTPTRELVRLAKAWAGLTGVLRRWATSGHRDGDEGQQKHQHGTGQRQDDRHHGNDGIDRILLGNRHIVGVCIVVGMDSWLGHGGS